MLSDRQQPAWEPAGAQQRFSAGAGRLPAVARVRTRVRPELEPAAEAEAAARVGYQTVKEGWHERVHSFYDAFK